MTTNLYDEVDTSNLVDESTNYAVAGMAAVALVGLLTGAWYVAYKVLNRNVKKDDQEQ